MLGIRKHPEEGKVELLAVLCTAFNRDDASGGSNILIHKRWTIQV